MDLLERAEPLDQLGRLMTEAASGHGRLALLGGEAGVGKTSLVRRFTRGLPRGVRTLWGGCDPLSLPRPLGPLICRNVIGSNAIEGVTWVNSYVRQDRMKTFCIYDAPSPEAIRRTAELNNLPVDRITQVSVLDPYFYR